MKLKDILMYSLAAIITVGFFVLLYILIFFEIPGENEKLLGLAVGALLGSFATVVSYFFGSSQGSKDKNDLLTRK